STSTRSATSACSSWPSPSTPSWPSRSDAGTVQIHFLGGATTVTGSQYLLETARARVLIDCGMFQGSPNESIRNRIPFAYDQAALALAASGDTPREPVVIAEGSDPALPETATPVVAGGPTAGAANPLPAWPRDPEAELRAQPPHLAIDLDEALYTAKDAER